MLLLTVAGLFPGTALALGVAGFDISRPNAKNPDSAFHFNIKPGESLEERVILRNTTTDTVQRLRIYSADGTPTSNGGIALKDRQDERTGLAKWIELDTEELISLEPKEERSIWFKLSVPTSSDSNENVAGIVVEQAEAVKGADKQFSVNRLSRVAILVMQRLPGPLNLQLDIIDFGRTNELWSQPVLFGLTLKNSGNVLVRPTGKVDIYNLFGGKSESIKLRRLPTIFPGRTAESQIEWLSAPPLGYFTANVFIEYGEGEVETKRARVLILPWWLIFVVFPLWLIARQARQRRAAKQVGNIKKTGREAQEAMESLARAVEAIEVAEPEPIIPVVTEQTKTLNTAAPAETITETETKPKRRGRPPKKKVEETATATPTTKPRRGRPPKKKVEETASTTPATKPKRGRPPKKKVEETTDAEVKPKRRGRPPKKKVEETASTTPVTKPKRGRPPKKKADEVAEVKPKRRGLPPKKKAEETATATPTTKPKRGRPPKKKVEETTDAEVKPKRRGRPPKKKVEKTTED